VNEFMLFVLGQVSRNESQICDKFGRQYIDTCLWRWNAVPLCDKDI